MEAAEADRAVAAATAVVAGLGLRVADAHVLNDSNRLVVRLLPCDVVARVSPPGHFASAAREVELARRLGATADAPIVRLHPDVEPRLHLHDDHEVSLWSHVEPVPDDDFSPAAYADALGRLHAGLRKIDLATAPHVLDRAESTRRDAADDRRTTPDLADADRDLLLRTLDAAGRAIGERDTTVVVQQLLHGEPHRGNVLATADEGPRFFDFENACYRPVEYDLAWVPDAVARATPDLDPSLLDACRGLVLAIIATHRWSAGDRHPSGRVSGAAFLDALRAGPPGPAIDAVRW
jgi:hypothetical protein